MSDYNQSKDSPEPASELFEVGEIVGAHGLSGQMKIRLGTNNPGLLDNLVTVFLYKPLDRERKPKPQTATAGSAQQQRDSGPSVNEYCGWHDVKELSIERRMLMLKLDRVPDRTTAERLVGLKIRTRREQLNQLEDDEWWVTDLVGLSAYDTDGKLVGTICDIVGEGAQLLEIKPAGDGDKDTILVPFVKALVPTVDIRNKRVEIVNLPGLLES